MATFYFQKTFIGRQVSTKLILQFNEIMSAISRSPLSANLKKLDQEIIFCAPFDEKSQNFDNLSKILAKESPFKLLSNILLISYDGNNNTLPLNISTYFTLYQQNCSKFWQKLSKI